MVKTRKRSSLPHYGRNEPSGKIESSTTDIISSGGFRKKKKAKRTKTQSKITDLLGVQVSKARRKSSTSSYKNSKVVGLRDASVPLLDLGKLVPGSVVARPSKTIKSPYVADVLLEDGTQVLAHAPMLNCAGMVVPGAPVSMTQSTSNSSKTSHVIQLAHELRAEGERVVVGAHPRIAETISKELMIRKLIPEFEADYKISSQKTFGNSRVDFVLEYKDGKKLLVEVKNVVCADYHKDQIPEGREKDGLYVSEEGTPASKRSALFPHGKKKPKIKVVSDRAIKHVHELTTLHQKESEMHKDVSSAILFIVNRDDCQTFRPCHETDLLFAQVLC